MQTNFERNMWNTVNHLKEVLILSLSLFSLSFTFLLSFTVFYTGILILYYVLLLSPLPNIPFALQQLLRPLPLLWGLLVTLVNFNVGTGDSTWWIRGVNQSNFAHLGLKSRRFVLKIHKNKSDHLPTLTRVVPQCTELARVGPNCTTSYC